MRIPGARGWATSPKLATAAVATLAFSVPIATWWIVGPLAEPVPSTSAGGPPPYDYIVRPPDVPSTVELLAGMTCLVFAVLSLLVVVLGVRRGTIGWGWVGATACVVVSGVVIGGTGRVVTAGTHGANIGGGALLLVVPPALITGWIATAVIISKRARNRRLPPPGVSTS